MCGIALICGPGASTATFRQMLDASPAPSLPLSYLVEIVSEYDARLLQDLSRLLENKRRELRSSSGQKAALTDKDNQEGYPRE